MRKITRILTVICLFIVVSNVNAQIKLGVLDLKVQGEIDTSYQDMLSDILRHELYKTGSFEVIERDRIKEVIQEYGLIQSGLVSDEEAVEIGNLLKVDQIAFGSIGKADNLYSLTVRLVDVKTGRLTDSEIVQKKCIFEDVATVMIPEAADRFIKKHEENQKAFALQRSIKTTPIHLDNSQKIFEDDEIQNIDMSLDDVKTSTITFTSETGNCTIYWNDKKALIMSQPGTGVDVKGSIDNIYPGNHMLKIFHNDNVWYDDIIRIGEGESLIINVEPDEFIIKTRMATYE